MSIPCILIPLLVGLISVVLGYFFGKIGNNNSKEELISLRDDLNNYKRMNSQLRLDLEKMRNQQGGKENRIEVNSESTLSIETNLVFDASYAKMIFGKKINENDFKVIEGIGPKIEELFKTSGILTWKALSETSVDRCKEILTKAGDRFQFHDPGTWPRQAKLAFEGKWDELKEWQNTLEGGREK
ncbi:MAG: hypothetical protein IE891_02280 [Flavobacteriaceae bacterium]|nr:hypothetical protein [Flavobacteriaceae bacterium]